MTTKPVDARCNMKVVNLSGSHFEMGKQLREQSLDLMAREWDSAIRGFIEDLQLEESVAENLLIAFGDEATTKISKTLSKYAPNQLELIKGMAEGRKSSPFNIEAKHFFLALYFDMIISDWHTQYKIVKNGGCSGIIIRPEASQTGEMLLGRNYDLIYPLALTQIQKECVPSDGYKTIALTQALWAGCHCGMNEKGLVIYYNLNHPLRDFDRTHRGMPYGLVLQDALETCATADDALDYIKNVRRSAGANLTVGDPRDAYVIEVSRKKFGVRTPEDGVLAETNHYVYPDMLSENLPEFPILRYNYRPLRDEPITTHMRFKTEMRLLKDGLTKGKLSMDYLKSILRSHDPNKKHSPCNHGPVGGTLASIITKPAVKEMYIAVGQPCLTTYEKVNL